MLSVVMVADRAKVFVQTRMYALEALKLQEISLKLGYSVSGYLRMLLKWSFGESDERRRDIVHTQPEAPPESTRRVFVQTRLSAEDARMLKELSNRLGWSMSAYLCALARWSFSRMPQRGSLLFSIEREKAKDESA
jgi:hypothetical protein